MEITIFLYFVLFVIGLFIAFYGVTETNMYCFFIGGLISFVFLVLFAFSYSEYEKTIKYEYYLNDVKHEIEYPNSCDSSNMTCKVDNVTIKVDGIEKKELDK